jgi:protein TonB
MRVAHAVHVIRVKKPDSPLRKKVFSPPAPPSRQEEAFTSPSLDPAVPVAEPDRPVLEFEIHPKLPPQNLALPSPKIRTVPIGAPRLKAAYGVGEIDRSLTPLAKPPPAYPMRARRRGVEGWVTVRFLVNERGEVSQVEIIDADPQGVFDQAVLRSVGGWRFEPGTVDGIPVKTRVETTVRFELQ